MKKRIHLENLLIGCRRELFSFPKVSITKSAAWFVILIFNRGIVLVNANPDPIIQKRIFYLIPAPQWGELSPDNIVIDNSWQLLSKIKNYISGKEIIPFSESALT